MRCFDQLSYEATDDGEGLKLLLSFLGIVVTASVGTSVADFETLNRKTTDAK